MIVLGECAGCGRLFGFSPSRVPSVRVDGEREPVCRDCMGQLNMRRVAAGLRPWAIHPEAYAPDPVGDAEVWGTVGDDVFDRLGFERDG